jgi:ATP-dependent DNA ligase
MSPAYPKLTAPRMWFATSNAAVIERRQEIQSLGGEGLMARNPALTYSPGRTKLLLKVL